MYQKLERLLEIAIIPAALATIPLTIAVDHGVDPLLVAAAEWLVWTVFLSEYTLTVMMAADRWGAARRYWIHGAIVVLSFPLLPALLSFVQFVRLVPFLRLLRVLLVTARGLEALRLVLGRREVVYMAAVTGLLILGSAGILTELEPETVKGALGNAIWWGLVTVSTVGYGDIVPATPLGRLLGLLLMVTGIGLVSTLAASISAHFIVQEKGADLEDLARRLDRIEALLQQRAAMPDAPTAESGPNGSDPAGELLAPAAPAAEADGLPAPERPAANGQRVPALDVQRTPERMPGG